MINWATIPYTTEANEAIEYLRKYRHDLILTSKMGYDLNGFLRFNMEFNCKICDAVIELGRYAGSEEEYRICANNSLNENPMFYCEKFRVLA
jgi:hypothetical protein